MPNDSTNAANSIAPSEFEVESGEGSRTSQPGRVRSVSRQKPGLTKVSANFVNRAMAALEMASEITGDNQTDVLNRSVQVYAYIAKMIDEGKLVFVEDPTTGARERLVLL